MFRILIDTCVWLDLAKNYKEQVILSTLEELIQQNEIELILPQTVVNEFTRNKARIIKENTDSISSTLKSVKDIVNKLCDPSHKNDVLSQLNDIDFRLPFLGEEAVDTINHVERIFGKTHVIDITDTVKLRAAQRAIDKRAPFHKQRNGIDDSIIIEVYKEEVKAEIKNKTSLAFITYNYKDFSNVNVNNKQPHPDVQDCFQEGKSYYFLSLSEALQFIQPEVLNDFMSEFNWVEEPRKLTEIVNAIDEFYNKVWYNRHQILKEDIEDGTVKIVEKETFPIKDHITRPIQKNIWEAAQEAAKKVENKYGIMNLGPWDDFEWGMINGKLSALRWVLGDEWDMLDT